jgi:SAM-dependent methyltransferase
MRAGYAQAGNSLSTLAQRDTARNHAGHYASRVDTEALLVRLVRDYPREFQSVAASYVERMAHDVDLVLRRVNRGSRLYDIGGGSGLFGIACAELGVRVTNVDDYRDLGPLRDQLLAIQRNHGVEVVECDVIGDGFHPDETADAITTFGTIEHLHHSPKALYHNLVDALTPGGWFIVSSPNAANLRKRVQFPFGMVGWSAIEDWYERPVMRAHVREPLARDLRYIARDLGLDDVRVFGRNFLGRNSNVPWRRSVTRAIDRLLQARPTLCSDLYMIGRKAEHEAASRGR